MQATRRQYDDALSVAPGPQAVAQSWGPWLMLAVALLLACRLALMWWGPLADTTEARYGELARQTAVNGYWLMPHMDAATPFFAKPPLSTWASAASMRLLGVNEFAARLPALLAALLAIWITRCYARALGMREANLVVPVLASSPLFFVAAGAVMTDAIQMTIVWAAQYCAWRALAAGPGPERRNWRRGLWALIGLGALSKGLATWALIGLPVFGYALLQRDVRGVLRALFDGVGVLLAAAICLPWYVAAELAYPGFLQYFIVGEHFARFLVPGWQGDRYGFAHRQPLGAIWLFWIGAVLPWLHVFVLRLLPALRARRLDGTPAERFLWCATLAPLLFFTFSRNIIWTYALTAVPPFSLLVVQWLEQQPAARRPRIAMGLAAFGLLSLLMAPLILRQQEASSDRAMVRAFRQMAAPGSVLAYATPPAFSSAFYTEGQLTRDTGSSKLVVIDNDDLARQQLPAEQVLFRGAHRSLVVKP